MTNDDAQAVTSRFLIRSGSVAFVEPEPLGDEVVRSGFRVGNFEAAADEIESLLKDCTSVKAITRQLVNTQAIAVLVRSTEVEGRAPAFMFGEFCCEMSLWRKDQLLPDGYQGDVIESFDLIYDGTTFCAIAEAPAKPGSILVPFYREYDLHFAHQVTRILEGALSKSAKHRPVILSPTPAFPCVRVDVVLDPSVHQTDLDISVQPSGQHLQVRVVAQKTDWTAREVATRIAMLVQLDLKVFYDVSQMREHLNLTAAAIASDLQSATAHYSELTSIRWWQLWRLSRFGLIRRIRHDIGKALERHVFFTSLELAFAQRANHFGASLESSQILAPQGEYFRGQLGLAAEWDIDSILRALRFFEEETRSIGIQRATVEAAIVWGFVGGFVVWALTQIFG